jgi:hypothetical protein
MLTRAVKPDGERDDAYLRRAEDCGIDVRRFPGHFMGGNGG